MATAGKYDIQIEAGATFRETYTWYDENDNPIDLTGASAHAMGRRSTAPSGETVWDYPNLTIADPPTGQIQLEMPAADTALLAGKGVWALEVDQGSGEVTRLLEGSFSVSPEVVHAP